MFSLSLFAQSHLEFRGVPINGHIDNFVAKMKTLGYVVEDRDSDGATMTGKFTNRPVTLYVFCSPKSKTVYSVALSFQKQSSWTSLKSRYLEYKELYTSKYGVPQNEMGKFTSPYYEGDGYEIQALKLGKCKYASLFEKSNGSIMITLSDDSCLLLYYYDKTNDALNEKESKSSALDDI